MAFYPVQAQDFALDGAGCTATATSLILTSMLKIDGTAFTFATDFGAIGYGVHEPDTSVEENVSFTGLTNNANGTTTLTGVTRGLRFNTPYTQDTALRQPHAGGSIFRLSNTAPFYNEFVTKLNNETIDGVKTHTASPIVPTPTTDYQAATKKYADDLAIAGAPDASTTVKGIVEAATSAELAAGTATGATGALLAATGASFNATSSAAVLVPVTNSSGKLSSGFGGAASSLATLNGSSKVVEDPANATATPTASKIPIADSNGKLDSWISATTNNSLTTGEAIDGSTTPQAVCVAAADGLIYLADGNTSTRVNAYGFITTNASITTTPVVVISGIVGGFSGLTKGAMYYVTDTAGSINVTPSTTCVIPVGRAITATQIELNFGKKIALGTITHAAFGSGASPQSVVTTTGFKPSTIHISGTLTALSSTNQGNSRFTADYAGTALKSILAISVTGTGSPSLSGITANTNPNATGGADGANATFSGVTTLSTTGFTTQMTNSNVGTGRDASGDLVFIAYE